MSHQQDLHSEFEPEMEPFLIRGHHATNYWRFLNRGYTPEFITKKLIDSAKEYKTTGVDNYFADVYGTSESDIAASSSRHIAVFKRFLDMPAETPVHFVVEQKDTICNTCVVGAHCTRPVDPDNKSDDHGVNAALIVARNIGIDNEIQPLDVNLPLEKSLQMPAQTAREILGTYDYGIVFDALNISADSLQLFLDVAGMPEYYDLITKTGN